MEERINELLKSMNSFNKTLYSKQELLPELLSLQQELINLTFNEVHSEKGNLRIWDVEAHLEKMNADCGHIADEQLNKVKASCKVICNAIKSEMSGQAGEYKAFRSLETLRCKNHILKNIEFLKGDHRTELDAVVITEKTIFIVEVKNPSKDIYIDERGNYCRVTDKLVFDKNIGEKMNDKDFLLREALKKCGVENIDIQSIVVFTNNSINVENRYPYIKTCFLSDMPHIIGGYYGERIFSDEDMEKIVSSVEINKCHECYPLPIDMQEFKKDFATLMATLETASKIKEDIVEIKDKDPEDVENSDAETVKNCNKTFKWFKNHRIASGLVVSAAVATLASVVAVAVKKSK